MGGFFGDFDRTPPHDRLLPQKIKQSRNHDNSYQDDR